MSLSAGVCTERTVVGLLNSEDTEYQCVGDAVTEAHLLATMFHEVLMATRYYSPDFALAAYACAGHPDFRVLTQGS